METKVYLEFADRLYIPTSKVRVAIASLIASMSGLEYDDVYEYVNMMVADRRPMMITHTQGDLESILSRLRTLGVQRGIFRTHSERRQ